MMVVGLRRRSITNEMESSYPGVNSPPLPSRPLRLRRGCGERKPSTCSPSAMPSHPLDPPPPLPIRRKEGWNALGWKGPRFSPFTPKL